MKANNLSNNTGYLLRWILCAVFISFCSSFIYGQKNNIPQKPIVAGTFGSPFQYSDSQNTIKFSNDYQGRPGNDVFYKFTLTEKMEITISHCGSLISDTYLSLLNALGTVIDYNDNCDIYRSQCSNYYHSHLTKILSAGTYYVVSEGYSENGVIRTTIQGDTNFTGNTLQDPILVGSFGLAFQYSDLQDTNNFTNNYSERSTNDVFYKFTLTKEMMVTIKHCESSLQDTYVYLLDASGNEIDYYRAYSSDTPCSNTSYPYLKKTLPAGTYYVVSEGRSENGIITTCIEGKIPLTGNTLQNPIVAGSFASAFQYSNSQNTVNFTNDYGDEAYDVFYKFTLTVPMEVTMSHCGSTLSDTYLSLLDASGNEIDYNDDYSGDGQCSSDRHSRLKKILPAGTYYVVSEGYSGNGVILTAIQGDPDLTGNTLQKPIVVGTLGSAFLYSNSQNTSYFTNNYAGRSGGDVFYKFTLTTAMEVTMSHCGSTLPDTYLSLLDASGNRIDYNDDYAGDDRCSSGLHSRLKKILSAGTYYVVSEGFSQNGVILTAIQGLIPYITYYYDASGNRTGRKSNAVISVLRSSEEDEAEDKEPKNRTINYEKETENPEEPAIKTETGLEEVEETGFNARVIILPNPTQGPLTVEISGYGEQLQGEIRIYNFEGRTVKHQKVISALTNIDLSTYPRGVYLLHIQLDGETVSRKIIKE
jgi:hypothetical protein